MRSHIDIWIPNIFEFKGGIQVYLNDFLSGLGELSQNHYFQVVDKLDREKEDDRFDPDKFSFLFSGNIPKIFQTSHFTWNLIFSAFCRQPSLIICTHLNFSPAALFLHYLLDIPYWLLVYGLESWSVQNPIKIRTLRQAGRIISISKYTRDRLIKEHQIPASQISLLPVTFDASRFTIRPKPSYLLERYHLHPSQPILLTVARLADTERFKGYDQVLKALPKIRQTLPNVHYLIVGKGQDKPRIEQLIKALGLQDHVTLTGFVCEEELGHHYNLCDLFAMPSKREGFGIVYLEALASGKPTIGGNQDGAVDALCKGRIGSLVDPDDIQVLADTVIQILQKRYPNQLLYQPEALRHSVIETYGAEQFRQRLSELLQADLSINTLS